MNWNQIEQAWKKVITKNPALAVVTQKVEWLEVRLHNAPFIRDLGRVKETGGKRGKR